MAAAIADRVRLLDTVARFGEDEFVVIAPGDAGGIVALRLRDAIAELPPIGEVEISVSAAVVHHPADGATGADLVAASELALHEAKSQRPGLDPRRPGAASVLSSDAASAAALAAASRLERGLHAPRPTSSATASSGAASIDHDPAAGSAAAISR